MSTPNKRGIGSYSPSTVLQQPSILPGVYLYCLGSILPGVYTWGLLIYGEGLSGGCRTALTENAKAGGGIARPHTLGTHRFFNRESNILACSTLSLLVAGIAANNEDNSTASHHLAILTNAFNAGADLHGFGQPFRLVGQTTKYIRDRGFQSRGQSQFTPFDQDCGHLRGRNQTTWGGSNFGALEPPNSPLPRFRELD